VAAKHFDCDPEDIECADGEVWHYLRPEERLRFGALARQAYLQRVSLFAAGHYKTPRISFDRESGKGKPFHYFAYGAAISEVEVDGFTGQYILRRVDILHDVGDSISPLVDLGQVEGGYIQGLGWLTQEELVWHPETGRLMTSGASTYKLPSLGECPAEFHVRLLPKATESKVVHGSKAVGEPPFMLAISAREALRSAAAAFGKGGVTELGLPATPEAVYWAVQRARASTGSTS
jgi:xanthine dehydrogenase large subunit